MQTENKLITVRQIDLIDYKRTDCNKFFCEKVYDPQGNSQPLPSQNCMHVYLIEEGNGVYQETNKETSCNSGDIFIVSPNVPHCFSLSDDKRGMTVNLLSFDLKDWFEEDVFAIGGKRFCYGVFSENSTMAYAMLNEHTWRKIGAIIEDIEVEVTEKHQDWRDAVRADLTRLLITVGRYINYSIKNTIPEYSNTREWNIVMTVMRMAEEHYSDCHFTLETVSDSLYMSKSYISRMFKEITGQLFSEYLRNLRIDNACRLLRDTDMNMNEIVKCCGVRDKRSFYHNFSTRVHMTPHEYRQTTVIEKIENAKEISKAEQNRNILNEISKALQRCKTKPVIDLIQIALEQGVEADSILNEGLVNGITVIGDKFKNNEVYVSEVMAASRAMNKGMELLKPFLAVSDVKMVGKVCLGTVRGDMHNIGKNLVKIMMECKGLEVIDLGTDVPPETFVRTAIDEGCQVICCSALLTVTMGVMADVVKSAIVLGVRDRVKIMVGGAPVTEEFCRKIGADIYTSDAATAADVAVELCKAQRNKI